MTLSLDFLPQTAFAYLLIFARVGALTMALPGIGDRMVPPRLRLVFALALSLIMYPLVYTMFPPLPQSIPGMLAMLVRELLVGLGIGFAVKLVVVTVQMAGTAIALQTGLAYAQNLDPSNNTQSSLFATFMSVMTVALIFATDLHYLLIEAIHDSYTLFRPGAPLPVGDMASVVLDMLARAFTVALQLAGPFIAFGLIFYLGIGVLARLIPQVQVFFLALPANIMFGFLLFMLLISTIMVWYLDYFADAISPFLA